MLGQKTLRARESLTRNQDRSMRALRLSVESKRRVLDGRMQLLSSLGHHSVLARGFVLVRDGKGHMVRTASSVALGDALEMEFADGRVGVTTTKVMGTKAADTKKPSKTRASGGSEEGPQGSLF
jgi:exodeoxyribonuclease VII large subunit